MSHCNEKTSAGEEGNCEGLTPERTSSSGAGAAAGAGAATATAARERTAAILENCILIFWWLGWVKLRL
jgi:hypothetical protein